MTVSILAIETGDIIQYSVFGKGEIIEIINEISSYVIKFEKKRAQIL